MDDQALITATRSGDRSAFGRLVVKYQDRLFNSIIQVLRQELDAQDVVQDAFVLAFTKLHSFQGNSSFYTWLFRIARNLAITRLRSRKSMVSLDATTNETSDQPLRLAVVDEQPLPDDRMQRHEEISRLHEALGRLSEEHRSILVLRELEDLDYDAIGEILQIPVGTVRSRLHRARMQLREELERMMDPQERTTRSCK